MKISTTDKDNNREERREREREREKERMPVAGTRKLCRVGLAAILVTALCILTLLDSPPARLPDPPTDPPPTPGGEPPGTRSIVAYSWARRLALDYRPTKQCDGNGTRGMALNSYEPPGTKWLETIPGRLFLYSAHLDLRIVGYPSIRVIGVKRGALPSSALFCTIWYREHGETRSLSVEALISTIWLDEWDGTADSYTGILVNCQLPLDDSIRRPSWIYVGPNPCYENASHSLTTRSEFGDETISVDRKGRQEFTLCIKGLDFDEDISRKLIAFVELHRILGAKLFYFYVFNVHENVLKVLRLYERSNVVRWFALDLPGDLPNEKSIRRRFFGEDIWTKRRMELIPYNHCFYENIHRSEFVVPIDIDEAIVPTRRKTWHELLLDERAKLGRSFKDFASYSVRNVYFFPELQNKSRSDRSTGLGEASYHSVEQYPAYLDTMRTANISPEGDSVKSFVSTRRALTVHNHYALATLNPSTRRAHHLDSNDVLKHHHRACDSRHLDCDLLMEDVRIDESALRYADELRTRMRITLADLDALP